MAVISNLSVVFLTALLAFADPGMQQASEPAQTRRDSAVPTASGSAATILAAAPDRVIPEGTETRRLCTFERVIGSNRQSRVCRDVPVNARMQNQETSDFLRRIQRVGELGLEP
jgi:hypothetical protein